MSRHDFWCFGSLFAYFGSLAVVSIVGMATGYPEALWVWVLPFLTGFSCGCKEIAEAEAQDARISETPEEDPR